MITTTSMFGNDTNLISAAVKVSGITCVALLVFCHCLHVFDYATFIHVVCLTDACGWSIACKLAAFARLSYSCKQLVML
jgi:hypothetical protein